MMALRSTDLPVPAAPACVPAFSDSKETQPGHQSRYSVSRQAIRSKEAGGIEKKEKKLVQPGPGPTRDEEVVACLGSLDGSHLLLVQDGPVCTNQTFRTLLRRLVIAVVGPDYVPVYLKKIELGRCKRMQQLLLGVGWRCTKAVSGHRLLQSGGRGNACVRPGKNRRMLRLRIGRHAYRR